MFVSQLNPVTSLMIGILAATFLQSSSTVTAFVIGLEETGTLPVDQGIYMVSDVEHCSKRYRQPGQQTHTTHSHLLALIALVAGHGS